MISLKADGAKFWDKNPCGGNWQDYRQFMNWYLATEAYLPGLLEGMDLQNKRCLDVGCGQGVMCNLAAQKHARMVGLDMSFNSLQAARQGARELGNDEQIHFVQGDAENLPFRNAAFETLISIGVLHHTPSIEKSIQSIQHALQENGQITVMLYRRGNPKWWATITIRTISRWMKKFSGKKRLSHTDADAPHGTALQELLDVPIMNAYSNHECMQLFAAFHDVSITNYQPGFARMIDFMPWLKIFGRLLRWIDIKCQQIWGFYQVIKARK